MHLIKCAWSCPIVPYNTSARCTVEQPWPPVYIAVHYVLQGITIPSLSHLLYTPIFREGPLRGTTFPARRHNWFTPLITTHNWQILTHNALWFYRWFTDEVLTEMPEPSGPDADTWAAQVMSVLHCNWLHISCSHLLGPTNTSMGFLCKEMQGTDDNWSIDLAGIVVRVCLHC